LEISPLKRLKDEHDLSIDQVARLLGKKISTIGLYCSVNYKDRHEKAVRIETENLQYFIDWVVRITEPAIKDFSGRSIKFLAKMALDSKIKLPNKDWTRAFKIFAE